MSMSEVDYTQFAYKRNVRKQKTVKEKIAKTEKVRTAKDGWFVFTVVLLCFALVFFLADFFRNGHLTDLVARAFKGNEYEYYLVVSNHSSREHAYVQSAAVRKGGGSGYVFQEEDYYVVYAVYPDKASAVAVAEKNLSTEVKKVSYKSKNTEVLNFCDKLIHELAEAANGYETGAMTESELLSMLSAQVTDAKAIILKIQDTKNKESVKLLRLAAQCLENIDVADGSRVSLAANVRYACSVIALNMAEYV